MRRVSPLLLGWVAGCTALNPAYGDVHEETGSGSGIGTGSGTGSASASGVGTGSSVGTDTVVPSDTEDPPVETTMTDPVTTTESGSSETSGVLECSTAQVEVTEDVFLANCVSGCAEANYGATSAYFVGTGGSSAYLLLRIPTDHDNVGSVDVTVTIRGAEDALVGHSLSAAAVQASCDWVPGSLDAASDPLDPGATWNNCTPLPIPVPWDDPDLSALSTLDPEWSVASVGLDPVTPGVVTAVTLTLERDSPGAGADSIVVYSDVPDSLNFIAFASESEAGPSVAVHYDCG